MVNRVYTLLAVCALVIVASGVAAAGNTSSKQKFFVKALPDERASYDKQARYVPLPPDPPTMKPLAGTYTTLTGYWDYQLNGGACQYIRVSPTSNGQVIHVIYMIAEDSSSLSPSRRTAYAYSSNGGASWNNFVQLRVPSRRSGYPSLDLLQGANAGSPVIVNHSAPVSDLVSLAFVDSPPGTGAFSELNTPPSVAAGDEPIWPTVAGTADGSIVMNASQSAANTDRATRTTDFSTWSAWTNLPPGAIAGIPTHANGIGRVGALLNTSIVAPGTGGIWVLESTNNGSTWPTPATMIYPTPSRIAGADTFQQWTGSDFVYNGNNPVVAINEYNAGANSPTDSAQIVFWSQATGFKVAASKRNTPGVIVGDLNKLQGNQLTMGYPSIGMSGSTIVIVYMAFRSDTSAAGYNYADIYMVQSGNGGNTWSTPVNLSNSRTLDERFPSISPWNEPGKANIVWQEDPQPGSSIPTGDGAPVARTRQVFLKVTLTDVKDEGTVVTSYNLSQNYPNPFNPSTKIVYAVPTKSDVRLTVYNMLGQKVATLVDGAREAGSYEADFSAANLSSGIYYYTLKAGQFTETKKMILLR